MRKPTRMLLFIATSLAVMGLFPRSAHAGRQVLWVTNAYGDDVHVIDVPSHKVLKRIVVGPQPHGIAVPADPTVVYISIEHFNDPLGELIWVDPKTYEIRHRLTIGPKPNQIACTPDGKFVYVPCDDGHYWVIDGHEKKVVTKIATEGRPHNTLCSPDGRRMYLVPMGDPHTLLIGTHGRRAADAVKGNVADRLMAGFHIDDRHRFFQQIDGLLGFQVADIPSRKVIATVHHTIPEKFRNVPSRSHGIAVRPDQKEIWAGNVEHGLVHVHDMTTPDYPEIATLPMTGTVYWLCFSPDSKYAYVSIRSQSKVCVVDCQTKQILTHIPVGDTPKRNIVITLPDAETGP